MQKTPLSVRKHIVLTGRINAGKSTLFNALLGQDAAIVSEIGGTTTDPVTKAMELIPYGPVTLIDTAGLGDGGTLGAKRMDKTANAKKRADLFLWVRDALETEEQPEALPGLPGKTPCITVFTKCDKMDTASLAALKHGNGDAVFLPDLDGKGLEALKRRIAAELEKMDEKSTALIGDLLPSGSHVVLVVPIDGEAPKGRLILPQVQLIRDCLDHDMKATVCKETGLAEALTALARVDLVVTDSQVFPMVHKVVPPSIPLTSFSMLLAWQKGDFTRLLNGVRAVPALKNGAKVLILEGCTHNHTHEDIGHQKIPQMLLKNTGKKLTFIFAHGFDLPADIEQYDLAVQCGSCMLNQAYVTNRSAQFAEKNIPITNYGILLAYLTGVLERAVKPFGV